MKKKVIVSRLFLLLFCVTLFNTILIAQEEDNPQDLQTKKQVKKKAKTWAFQLSFQGWVISSWEKLKEHNSPVCSTSIPGRQKPGNLRA